MTSIAQLLKDYGASGVAALAIVWAWHLFGKLEAAHKREVEAYKAVLPITERMTVAVAVVESKRKRGPNEITNPGTPNPLLPVVKP